MSNIILNYLLVARTFGAVNTQRIFKKNGPLQGTKFVETEVSSKNNEVTDNQYEEMIRNSSKVSFRKYAFSKWELNKTKIENLTPLYIEFMNDKNDL